MPFGCALHGPVVSYGVRFGCAVDELADFDMVGARANDIAGTVDAPQFHTSLSHIDRSVGETGRMMPQSSPQIGLLVAQFRDTADAMDEAVVAASHPFGRRNLSCTWIKHNSTMECVRDARTRFACADAGIVAGRV